MPAGMYENQIPLKDLDRLDRIAETQMDDTEFFSSLAKGKELEKLDFHGQLQKRDKVGHGGARDGEDQTEFNAQERIPIMARSQEFREPWKVTQKIDYTTQIGGAEKVRQKAIAALKLREKVQNRALSDAAPVLGNKVIPDETGGAFWWMMNPVSDYFTLPEEFRVPAACRFAGALSDFHEETLQSMMAGAFKDRNGGKLTLDGWVGIDLKNRFDAFSVYDTQGNGDDNLRVFTYNGASKTIIRCVDFLHMSVGMVRLHPTTYLLRDKVTGENHADAHRSGLFLDMKQWYWRFNKTWNHTDLPNGGGGPRGFWMAAGMLAPIMVTGQLAIRCNAD
jgi:hypothetical protein